jgi:nanoRNase/pAp phosphatase (c-di-AMP/oligoRNAs hydrolase)
MDNDRPTAINLIRNARSIAIFPDEQDLDSLISAVALAHLLIARGARAKVYISEPLPYALSFLGTDEIVVVGLDAQPQLIVEIPTQDGSTQSVSYERTSTSLKLFVTSSTKAPSPESVSARRATKFAIDCIVTLGITELRTLTARFSKHADIFYDRTVVELGFVPTSELFGTSTLLNAQARSCAEIVHQLARQLSVHDMSAQVATALLAALYSKTESFQRSATTPTQFDLAANLIEQGADRHAVITNLFKTKPLAHLKLWGKILSQAQPRSNGRIFWATVADRDLPDLAQNPGAMSELLQSFLVRASRAELICLVIEHSNSVTLYAAASRRSIQTLIAQLNTGLRLQAIQHAPIWSSCTIIGDPQSLREQILRFGELFVDAGYTGSTPHAKPRPAPTNSQPTKRLGSIHTTRQGQPSPARPNPQRTAPSQEVRGR